MFAAPATSSLFFSLFFSVLFLSISYFHRRRRLSSGLLFVLFVFFSDSNRDARTAFRRHSARLPIPTRATRPPPARRSGVPPSSAGPARAPHSSPSRLSLARHALFTSRHSKGHTRAPCDRRRGFSWFFEIFLKKFVFPYKKKSTFSRWHPIAACSRDSYSSHVWTSKDSPRYLYESYLPQRPPPPGTCIRFFLSCKTCRTVVVVTATCYARLRHCPSPDRRRRPPTRSRLANRRRLGRTVLNWLPVVCWQGCYHFSPLSCVLSFRRYARADMAATRSRGLSQTEDDTYEDEDDNCSDVSSTLAHSVVSTVPDKHGFLGGAQYINESWVPQH